MHAVVELQLARDDVLRQLVGCDRCERDRRERKPLRRACGKRALGERYGRQPVCRRADADVEPADFARFLPRAKK